MEMRHEVEHGVRNGFAQINFSSIKCRFILTKKVRNSGHRAELRFDLNRYIQWKPKSTNDCNEIRCLFLV